MFFKKLYFMTFIFLLVFFILLLSVLIYMLFRNNRVCEFREQINNLCYRYNMRQIDKRVYNFKSAYDWFYFKLPSYKKMMYSLKPLKLEKWMSAELIKKLFE